LSRRLSLIAWKEGKEVVRDKRALALMLLSVLAYPLLGALIAVLSSSQVINVAVKTCDQGPWVERLLHDIEEALKGGGVNYTILSCSANATTRIYDLIVTIPPGFNENASSLDKPVYISIVKAAGSPAADTAYNKLSGGLSAFTTDLARYRVRRLASLAGVKLEKPDNILAPLRILESLATPTGAPAPAGIEQKAWLARFLSMAIFFLVAPASTIIVDSIVGERERRTLEMLAASPATPSDILLGKLVTGVVIAVIASIIDLAGVAILTATLGIYYKGLTIDPLFAAFHSLQVFIAILVTCIFIELASVIAPSTRAASTTTSLVTAIAAAIFMSALFVDFTKLQPTASTIMQIIPYTHTVLAITAYVIGDKLGAAIHTIIAAAYIPAAELLALRLYNTERIIRSQ